MPENMPFGLGTNRFPVKNINDEAGIESSVNLVLHALNKGVSYIDVAQNYSHGTAFKILRLAFQKTNKSYDLTLKFRADITKDADAVRRHTEQSLSAMGINRATYAVAWSIFSFDEFKKIIRRGSVFDGMQRLKDEGIVERICFSTHAPVSDIINILETNMFDGVTISFSILNSNIMTPVLKKALQLSIDVAIMNPLGGGIIPQNRDFFSFICSKDEKNAVQASLRYIIAHPAVSTVIIGPSSINEFDENFATITSRSSELNADRILRVNKSLKHLTGFCTGCNYCNSCPKNIPISAFMQSRNTLRFKPTFAYNRSEIELLRNIHLFKKLIMDFNILPETADNPCVKCGTCESRCTQKLSIIESLEDLYKRVDNCGFSQTFHKKRLDELLNKHGYRKVGIYPSGGYFARVKAEYSLFFGEPKFDWVLFNSDPSLWGTMQDDSVINEPRNIGELQPDVVLICNYNYSNEIYESIKQYKEIGIHIKKLHDSNSVPWLF